MLIRHADLEAMFAGTVDLAFRTWKRPTVKTGGTLRTKLGVLEIVDVSPCDAADITDADARRAGLPDRDAVLACMQGRKGTLHRVQVRPGGVDPRIALRNDADLSPDDITGITQRLARLDKASKRGPWTATILQLIADNPGVRAPDLAAQMGHDKPWFKAQVRKLKELGLTVSLEVGYELSPRGEAYRSRC